MILIEILAILKNMFETCGICARRARKLYKARSRLYRSRFLQPTIRWKALAETYKVHYNVHFFAQLHNLFFCSENANKLPIVSKTFRVKKIVRSFLLNPIN